MPTTNTQRMAAIAQHLFEEGWYTMAASVDAITAERDAMARRLEVLSRKPDPQREQANGSARNLSSWVTRHADAITPDVPPGYDTVLGFLAKYHPDVLDDVDYHDPKVTQRYGYWLIHQCNKLGLGSVKVPAPACLRDKAVGIDYVNAWPLKLLDERWG